MSGCFGLSISSENSLFVSNHSSDFCTKCYQIRLNSQTVKFYHAYPPCLVIKSAKFQIISPMNPTVLLVLMSSNALKCSRISSSWYSSVNSQLGCYRRGQYIIFPTYVVYEQVKGNYKPTNCMQSRNCISTILCVDQRSFILVHPTVSLYFHRGRDNFQLAFISVPSMISV